MPQCGIPVFRLRTLCLLIGGGKKKNGKNIKKRGVFCRGLERGVGQKAEKIFDKAVRILILRGIPEMFSIGEALGGAVYSAVFNPFFRLSGQ